MSHFKFNGIIFMFNPVNRICGAGETGKSLAFKEAPKTGFVAARPIIIVYFFLTLGM